MDHSRALNVTESPNYRDPQYNKRHLVRFPSTIPEIVSWWCNNLCCFLQLTAPHKQGDLFLSRLIFISAVNKELFLSWNLLHQELFKIISKYFLK